MVYSSYRKNGLVLAAFSSLVFAFCSLIAKQLDGTHPIQLCLYSFISVFLFSGFNVLKQRNLVLPRGCYYLVLLRSACGCTFFILSFYSVQLLPLGDASVLLYTTPVWTMILARVFIEEPCRMSHLFSVCIAMFGVGFVTQPEIIFGIESSDESEPSSSNYPLGVVAAVLASISEALGNVVLRKLKNVDPPIILFNYSMVSLMFCLSVGLLFDCMKFPQCNSLLLIFLLSFLTVTEQYLMAYALTLEHAGPVAIVQASDIIYGYILEVLFYNEDINLLSLIGAFIVGAVVIQMALNKRTSSQPPVLTLTSV